MQKGLGLISLIGAALVATSLPANAGVMTVNFESFTTGALPGGPDPRLPGNAATWWVPDNAATGAVVSAGVGRGGSAGLHVTNRGNGNDGVIDNVKSGRLAQAAGESSTGAPHRNFASEFWFRTESTTSLTGFQFKTESWGTDRTTWLGFLSGDNRYVNTSVPDTGKIYVEASGYTTAANGSYVDNQLVAQLDWGAWYRVVTEILFIDGPDNDQVTYSIYDEIGGLVGSLANNTWEQGQRDFGFNGGNVVAPDAIGFQLRGSSAVAGRGVFIDDVSWRSFSVPTPTSLALVLLAMAGALAARRATGARA
jgi:hypothetical protein